MEKDDQQQEATPATGAAEEPSGQPEQVADANTPPAVAPSDVTIPPNIYPGYPPNPGTYPPQPGYPGAYPLPQPPAYVPPGYAAPQYPGYPPAPYPYGPPTGPGYGYPPTQPPVAVATMPPWMPPAPPKREPSGLGKPFPLAVTVGVGAAAVLVPALAYFIRVLALQGDWSAGAQFAGIFALVGLSIAVVGAIVRLIAGRNAAMFFVLTVLLLALLGGSSVGALAMSNPLHRIQAQSYESQSQWEAAIREYKLSGEEGADTADVARVYDEWGEQFLGQQSYSDAVDRFLTVLTDYRSDAAAVARAHRDLYKTYVAWLKDSPDDVPYAEAVTALTTYGTDSACDATCKADIAVAAPQALYLYGTQLAGDHRYAQAITQFEKLTADYAQSDYAPKAHSAAATAYYAEGQAELAQQSCTQAVDTYRTLVSKYGDTPEAAKARTALAAPQDVHGTITNFPKNPIPTMHLSHSINPKKFEFSNEYTTKPSSSGSYVFKKVKQGKYYITSSQPISGGTEYGWWYTNSTKTSYYSIAVGPLCSANADELPF